jgi:hypothetical protein
MHRRPGCGTRFRRFTRAGIQGSPDSAEKLVLRPWGLQASGIAPTRTAMANVSRVSVSDNADGTYKNPIHYAEHSDPDVIRVGDDFYVVASSFGAVPGVPIPHSKDLVNWTIIGHVFAQQPPKGGRHPARSMKRMAACLPHSTRSGCLGTQAANAALFSVRRLTWGRTMKSSGGMLLVE